MNSLIDIARISNAAWQYWIFPLSLISLFEGVATAGAAAYDSDGRLTRVGLTNAPVITFTYDAASNITALTTTAANAAPQITSDLSVTGYLGSAFSYAAKSSKPKTVFTGTGVPQGLKLSSAGAITGKATLAGSYAISLTATAAGQSVTETLYIHVRPAPIKPAVTKQPESLAAILGQPVTLFAEVAGSGPMTYQWKRGSTVVAGATSPTLIIPEFAIANEGDYTLTAKNAAGTVTTASARLARLQPLAFNGESYGLPLILSGNANWFPQTDLTYNGAATLRSGAIGNSQKSTVTVEVTGPGILNFLRSVSSESSYDWLRFRLDETAVAGIPDISGEQGWQASSVIIPSGKHTASWTYEKDSSRIAGQDRAWLADAYFVPGHSLNIALAGGGQVSRSPAAPSYATGQAVTVTAKADSGRYFAGWSGDVTSTANPLKVTMKTSLNITALFKEDLGYALGLPGLAWSTGGNADWFGQPFDVQDGAVGGKSGAIGHEQTTWVETKVAGPGTIVFAWKVSSQLNDDFLTFAINGKSAASISGAVNWVTQTLDLPKGTHTLRWTYSKGKTGIAGSDAAWLDAVQFLPMLPWAQLGGTYHGIALAEVIPDSAGAAKVTISSSGALSGQMGFQNKVYSLTGAMSHQGAYAREIKRPKLASLQVNLQLDPATLLLSGSVSDGVTDAEVTAYRAIYSTKNPAPQTGLWTLGFDAGAPAPSGHGYATLNVAKTGTGTVAGELPDGTKLTGSLFLAPTGYALYFLPLNSSKGFLAGHIHFNNAPLVQGDLHWSRPALPADKYFKAAFETAVSVEGSMFQPPLANVRVLAFADAPLNGRLTTGAGVFASSFSSAFTLDLKNKITFPTSPQKYALAIAKNGLFTGSLYDTTAKKVRSLRGVILQQQNAGRGLTLDANISAKVEISPE